MCERIFILGGDNMSEIVVNLNLSTAGEDELLSSALDAFLSKHSEDVPTQTDMPQLMVRTAFTPDGEISKKLIFQNRKWAEAFVTYWEKQKLQGYAA